MFKYLPFFMLFLLFSCKKEIKDDTNTKLDTTQSTTSKETLDFIVHPISHASMVLEWDGSTIFVDPVGGSEPYAMYNDPDFIVITDIHGDHLNIETVNSVIAKNTVIIAPKAVAEKLPEEVLKKSNILRNGDRTKRNSFQFTAIPMYNLRPEALKFHEKGRGNGYVISHKKTSIYISGDTEDIPEMRALKDIDIAFVCMNLPYTMTVENAASAVVDFAPKTVYPYHYRGPEGLSDVSKFKELVTSKNEAIEVVQLDWYPN